MVDFLNIPDKTGQDQQNQYLQQIATSLGVTTDALNSAVNLANTAGNNANAKIADVENRFQQLTSKQQQDAEVVSARQSTVKSKIFASLDARLEEDEQDFKSHKADYASLFLTNANAKNSIYRGKYLGSSVTTEQYQAISSGTFTDLYIGDYWTIGGVNWRIAAFNYYRNIGDSLVPGNHITLVPDTQLYTHVMNDTNTTTGGYTGSKMYAEGLEQAKTTIRGIFGSHLIKHRQYLCNAVADGKASAGAWVDSEVDLMNEVMIYGSVVNGDGVYGLYNIGVGKSQLPLFSLNPRMINTRQTYWLRDVASSARFARVDGIGSAYRSNASLAYGVRPAFSIS